MSGLTGSFHFSGPVPRTMTPAVETIDVQDVEAGALQAVVAAWQKWRGRHAMPSREKIAMRDLGVATRHISLVRVVDDGDDYEFRIIGDAHVQAYGTSFQNRLLSELAAEAPRFAKQLKASFDLVRITRKPCAFRGSLGSAAKFSWFETCYLPFGGSDVDYIVNAAVYSPYT